MTTSLLAALDRLPPRWRRVAVGLLALVLIAVAITALILEAPAVDHQHRKPLTRAPVGRRPSPTRLAPRTAHLPISASELRRAREVAERFTVSYLRFAYGRATARSVVDVAPAP